MKKRPFTLLEIMMALVLIVIASTAISYQMRGAIAKKKFTSNVERIKARLFIAQKMSMATQSDWTGLLKKEADGWSFTVRSDEQESKQFTPLHLDTMEISLNGKKIPRQIIFDFFASGHTSPNGTFTFKRDEHQTEWKVSDLFQRNEGKKLGPAHPND